LDIDYILELRSISKEFYAYKKRLIRHVENQCSDIWDGMGNPLPMYSNIEMGTASLPAIVRVMIPFNKIMYNKLSFSLKDCMHYFNNVKPIIIFLLAVLFNIYVINLQAQNIRVSGFVADEASLERLPGAYLSTNDNVNGTISNSYGFFSFQLPSGRLNTVSCYFLGYEIATLSISAKCDTMISFLLKPSALRIEEVTVTGRLPINRRLEMSLTEIPMKQVSSLPALGGETDILKALQLMPGIKSGNEAGSGILSGVAAATRT
jgi:hypothetical protein